ncbi:alkaline phosphatase D family protein [Lysobacter sp. GX 14042]|uniref:alkaline phosphatase D family protein n=1 Tax=Lysobacter sp. GX 14042 TaxID=2907155 RepID=UPI001F32ED3D|nr:alkaline phosphatase D family protein [Lysobacter sp. GX 14042]MCE7031463.1 alkaline phosphatase D family protein [Lysobacter sp. GX 14042]
MSRILLSRRQLLAGMGGLAVLAGLGPVGRVWAAPRFHADPFSLGVAAGDPLPDGFVIWTRLAPEPLAEHGGMPSAAVPVRWEVAEDARFGSIVRTGEALARPELAHSVHVELAGLQPSRPYWYRFHVDGADTSPEGVARTAPAPGTTPDRVRIAVAGCQAYYHGWFDAYRHLAAEPELDAVFHYGDYIYEGAAGRTRAKRPIQDENGNPVNRDHVGGEIYSLDDYRRRYALYKCDPDLKAAHASVAFVSSFDDHEVDNDFAAAHDQDGTPPEVFRLRRFAAMQAWYEHMPVRPALFPRPHDRTAYYRRLDYGRLLRMHVLDTRSHRDDQPCVRPGQENCRTGGEATASILGRAQEDWLDQGLGRDTHWNLLAQQVFVMPLKARAPDGRELPPFVDKWDGYPASRAKLVRSITSKNLTNVVIASGDAHMNAIGTVPLRDDEPDGPAVATEFLASSISSNGDGALETPHVRRFIDGGNPHLALVNDLRGYQVHEVSADQWRTEVKAMDQVQRKGGRIRTVARFAVSPDRPQLHRL